MSYSKLFSKVPIEVPNRSGFDESHSNFFTSSLGTLTPCFCDFLIPDDEVDLGASMQVQLPPMATDFYGRIDAKCEAFFVPCRILFGGWKDFITYPFEGRKGPTVNAGQQAKYLIGASLPDSSFTLYDVTYNLNDFASSSLFLSKVFEDLILPLFPNGSNPFYSTSSLFERIYSPGTLLDYLGFKVHLPDDYYKGDLLAVRNASQYLLNGSSLSMNVISANTNTKVSIDITSMASFIDRLSDTSPTVSFVLYDNDSFENSYATLVFVLTGERDGEVSVSLSGLSQGFEYPTSYINNILPIMTYHKIYDDWYRDSIIQQPLFERQVANNSVGTTVANMPWITSGLGSKTYFSGNQLNFANGHYLFDLHQRNWQKDYLISATPEPQAGDASKVSFEITGNSGEFTIASLRAANALQQWLDRNNLAGYRYGDQIYSQYGVYPSDAVTDRAIYLGQMNVNVYNKSVYQQTLGTTNDLDTNNPFNAIGAKYSNPQGVSQGRFCNNYRVTEHGFLMVIFSLVPQAYYSTGVKRMFNYSDISDIAFPLLAGVGDQEIYGREIVDNYGGTGDETVFGYTQRYAEYKFMEDEVHGLLRDGESLSAFALQRSFNEVPQLGSEFLQIPKDYLDQVSATNYKISEFGCWVDCYFDYKKSSKLPAYSIPTLGEMKNTHTEIIDKGGKRL